MKKRDMILSLAGTALLSSIPACTNLDKTVYDNIPADSFGYTDSEISVLVETMYKTLKNYPTDGDFIALDVVSGSNAVTPTHKGNDWYDDGQYREIYVHTWTSQASMIKGAWSTAPEAIGTRNANLKVVESSDFLSDEQMSLYISEVRDTRTLWIYKMMSDWGNIPLVTDYVDKELPACQPRQAVFGWLIEEVTEIAGACPGRENGCAKFTRGAAYTLLAKLYLSAEAQGAGYNNAYQMAAECCNKVMVMGYILEPGFRTDFSLTNKSSRGAILAAPFSETDMDKDNRWQLTNRALHYKDQLALPNGVSVWNGVCVQPKYVRLLSDDDPREEVTFSVGQVYNASTGEPIEANRGFLSNHMIDVTMLTATEYDGTTWETVNQRDGVRYQR